MTNHLRCRFLSDRLCLHEGNHVDKNLTGFVVKESTVNLEKLAL